jgi:hypothetical protein
MSDDRKTLTERLADHAIEASATRNAAPDEDLVRDGSDAWLVTLINRPAGQAMTVEYYTGSGLRERMAEAGPSAEMVLEDLLSDATGYLNSDGFEDWASEYGFDTEDYASSNKARRTYNTVKAQTEELQHFLGELFDTYAWGTESE